MKDKIRICQNLTTPVAKRIIRKKAQLNCTYWEPNRSFCRLVRSANTPPNNENSTMGMVPRKESRPRKKADLESCKTSQLWAICCMAVPMLEVQAPIHMTRKSRYWKHLKTRSKSAGLGSGEGFFAVDEMEDVAIGVCKE